MFESDSEARRPTGPICSRCGRTANLEWNGEYFCADDYREARADLREQTRSLMALMNFHSEQIENATGLPQPRIQIPPALPRTNPVNYVQINNSTVGVLNTGTIQNLQLAMNDLLAAGHQDVAEALRTVSEAALNDTTADPSIRNEVAEQVESLAEQAVRPPGKRKTAVVKATMARIGQLVGALSTAEKAWDLARPIIQAHLGVG